MKDYFDSAKPKQKKKNHGVSRNQTHRSEDPVQFATTSFATSTHASQILRMSSPDRPPASSINHATIPDHRERQPLPAPLALQLDDHPKPQCEQLSLVETQPQPPVQAKKKRIRVKTERRREQCRLNQARYRNRLRTSAVGLEDYVLQLQQHVQQLEAQRQSLYHCVNTRDSATRVVMEYFRLFQGGLSVYEPLHGSSRPPLETQIRFVTSAFHHHTRVGDDYGCDNFLEQCRRFSTFYDGLRILPQHCIPLSDPGGCVTVEARVVVQLTITETTIRHLYPHLLTPLFNRIKWKMLGQRMNCNASHEFAFDEDGKVASVAWTIDFVDALHKFLTIEETAFVLDQAHVARDAYLLVESETSAKENTSVAYAACSSDDEGFLIHDGKGDDYVMV